jgi:2-(3-amino-3-carboxypropyl)histidine synthase
MPRLLLIDAKWEGEIKMTPKLKAHLKKTKPKSIDLFASVQFADINNFLKDLKKLKIKVNIQKVKRTNKPLQILGCDCYPDSFEQDLKSDMILYLGDGMFHPKALILATTKPITIFDPISDQIKVVDRKDMQKELMIKKRNLKKFLNADRIGILVTIKPGQQYFLAAKKLKVDLEKEGKKAYIFIDDTLNPLNYENYPFVQCWVNTACPRIGTDDIVNFSQAMINLRDALDPGRAFVELEK